MSESKNKILDYLRERDTWACTKRVRVGTGKLYEANKISMDLRSLNHNGLVQHIVTEGKHLWKAYPKGLTDRQRLVIREMSRLNRPATRLDVQTSTGLPARTVQRELTELLEKRLVSRFGDSSLYHWSTYVPLEELSPMDKRVIDEELNFRYPYESKKKKRVSNDSPPVPYRRSNYNSGYIALTPDKFKEDVSKTGGVIYSPTSASDIKEQLLSSAEEFNKDLFNTLIDRLIETQIELRRLKGEI